MTRSITAALAALFLLPLFGCGTQPNPPAASSMDPILTSYYAGQSSDADLMLQKSIFQSLLGQWTAKTHTNPVFHYDTFTEYYLLDGDMTATPATDPLYCCTFSDGQGKYGYLVVSYTGSGLSQVAVSETPYPYDLQANLAEITAALTETGLDLSTATAARVRLPSSDQRLASEGIRITDGQGRSCLFTFGESSVTLAQ